jgi:hypothetical protein
MKKNTLNNFANLLLKNSLLIFCFVFVFTTSNKSYSQIQPTMAVRGTINSFGNDAMTYRSTLAQTWIATVQATSSNASAGFLFANNGSFSPKWARGAAVTVNSQTTWFANGADGTYNQTNGNYYTFICQDQNGGTNSKGYLFETSAAPISVSSVTQSPISSSVTTSQSVTVTANLSSNLPTGQGVFLRYSTNSFSTSTIVNMTGSGTNYTASIPSGTNVFGANVVYYVFTSGGTTPPLAADCDLATINLNNNSGSNFTYTVTAAQYTWNQTGTASYAVASNWTPTRTTPATSDILLFNNAASTTVTNIPTQTIGGLLVSNNTTVNFQPAAANTLTIGNVVSGFDLSLASGSALNANGVNALILTLATGSTASISGSMAFSTSANIFSAIDANGITFNNGSSFTQGTGNTGNVFGSGTSNSVIFINGSTFNHNAGANPFQKTQPASVVVFNTGSNYIHNQAGGSGLGFSGRTYSNLSLIGGGTATLIGGSPVYIDNLSVSGTTTLNMGMTGTGASISSINGNITVAAGSLLNFNGTAASIQFNGVSNQIISGSGSYTIATGQTVNIPSTRTTLLQSNLTITGTGSLTISGTIDMGSAVASGTGIFNLNSGATIRTANTGGLASSGASGSVQTTTRTLNSGANYIYNGSANQITGTGLPTTIATLTINNTGTSPNNVVALTGITGISGTTNSLLLQAGKLDLNNKQLGIPAGGTIVSTGGDFTATAGPVNFVGTGTVSGTVNFPTVVINLGVDFGASSNIVTSLQINSGGFVNANAPTYGINSTLIYNSGGTYGRNVEFGALSGQGYPYNVTVQNGTTLDLSANGFADRAIAGNLNLGIVGAASAGSLTMGATTNKFTVGGNIVIGGNTSGTSTLTLSSVIGGDVYLSGNWDTKTNGSYASNTRAVFFQGSGTSTVTTIGAATFDYLFINKTSGGTVSLANDMTVNNNLTLNAQLVTNSFKVIIPNTSGVTANSGGWVNGNLQKNIATGTNSKTFEIGDATSYTPVITAFSGVTSAGNLVVRTDSGDHPQITSSGIDNSKSVNRYYTLTNSGIVGGTYNPTFTFVAGDIDGGASTSNFVVRRYVNPNWFTTTTGTRTSITTQATGLSSYGEFQLGEAGTITVNTQPSNVVLCSGNSTSFTSNSLSTPTPIIKWQRDAGSGFIDIDAVIDGGVYTNFTTTTLNISNVTGLNTYLYRAVFSNINGTVNSNSATLTVNPNVTASVTASASPSGAICAGTSVTFTATPTNGGSTPTYQWKINGTNVSGETASTFTTTTLVNSDVVTVEMTSNTVCVSGSPATSSGITIIVNPNVTAGVSASASPSGAICAGTSVTFTATPTNGGSTPTYQWKINGTNVSGQTTSTFTTTTLANSDVVTVEMTSNALCVSGSPATSSGITITVNPNVTASVSASASPSGAI